MKDPRLRGAICDAGREKRGGRALGKPGEEAGSAGSPGAGFGAARGPIVTHAGASGAGVGINR